MTKSEDFGNNWKQFLPSKHPRGPHWLHALCPRGDTVHEIGWWYTETGKDAKVIGKWVTVSSSWRKRIKKNRFKAVCFRFFLQLLFSPSSFMKLHFREITTFCGLFNSVAAKQPWLMDQGYYQSIAAEGQMQSPSFSQNDPDEAKFERRLQLVKSSINEASHPKSDDFTSALLEQVLLRTLTFVKNMSDNLKHSKNSQTLADCKTVRHCYINFIKIPCHQLQKNNFSPPLYATCVTFRYCLCSTVLHH